MKKKREHFVTCGQMKVLERRADENGLSYYQMMENAGTGAAEIIMEKAAYRDAVREDTPEAVMSVPMAAEDILEKAEITGFADIIKRGVIRPTADADAKRVFVFCGKGNNGGDGFVVARVMCDAGFDVSVILVDGKPKTEDAITNYGLLKERPVRVLDMDADDRTLMTLKGMMPDIIVDAIYGTGFKGKLRGNGLKAAIYINRYSRRNIEGVPVTPVMVAALDIPSGLAGDLTNEKNLHTSSVKVHYTITFHAKKPVHLQKFAEPYCGEISVVDIGIDEKSLWDVDF